MVRAQQRDPDRRRRCRRRRGAPRLAETPFRPARRPARCRRGPARRAAAPRRDPPRDEERARRAAELAAASTWRRATAPARRSTLYACCRSWPRSSAAAPARRLLPGPRARHGVWRLTVRRRYSPIGDRPCRVRRVTRRRNRALQSPISKPAIDAELHRAARTGRRARRGARAPCSACRRAAIYAQDSLSGPANIIGAALAIGRSLDDVAAWPAIGSAR